MPHKGGKSVLKLALVTLTTITLITLKKLCDFFMPNINLEMLFSNLEGLHIFISRQSACSDFW